MSRTSAIVRGTTTLQTFWLPYEAEDLNQVSIVYSQNNRKLFEKTKADLTVDEDNGKKVSVTLTPEETRLFEAGSMAAAQMRILTANDEVLQAKKFLFHIGDALDDSPLEADDE